MCGIFNNVMYAFANKHGKKKKKRGHIIYFENSNFNILRAI